MLPFEWVASAWFAALFLAAPWTGAGRGRRAAVMGCCAALVLLIGAAAVRASPPVRAWLPHAYLVLGYWLPGLLAPAVAQPTAFERWLRRSDSAIRPHLPAAPARLSAVLELSYLLCYPLVPAAFAVVWAAGGEDDVDRFWVAVLAAGYACYGSLPWLVSRPPRIAEPERTADPRHPLAAVNAFVLGRVSHQLTTFPSGHVAVSWAAAGVLSTVSAAAGSVVAVAAAAIAVAAAAGRYHYVIDVVLGLVVAALALAAAAAL